MTTNSGSSSTFFHLSYGVGKGIETLEEQRAINANGVQMICIQKPSSKKETNSEEIHSHNAEKETRTDRGAQ